MKVVLDTNVIVSRFMFSKGAPAQILQRWRARAFELLVSEPILAEYRRVLADKPLRARFRATAEELEGQTDSLQKFSTMVKPAEQIRAVLDDSKDDMFLECAVAGGADYIVSGDAHLLTLREYRGIQILSPAVFLAVMEYEGR